MNSRIHGADLPKTSTGKYFVIIPHADYNKATISSSVSRGICTIMKANWKLKMKMICLEAQALNLGHLSWKRSYNLGGLAGIYFYFSMIRSILRISLALKAFCISQ
jgi:hypothetical protein